MAIGEVKYCPQCGKIVDQNDKFCQQCGALTNREETSEFETKIRHKSSEDEKIKETLTELENKVKKRAAGLRYPGTEAKKEAKEGKYFDSLEKRKSYLLIFSWIIIVLSVMFILYFVAENINEKPASVKKDTDNPAETNVGSAAMSGNVKTDNPAYLLAPEQFVVEDGVQTNTTATDGQTAWVEEVIDENTIKISYVEHTSNKNKLKFSQVELAGLSKYDRYAFHCNPDKLATSTGGTRLKQAKDSAILFMKNLLDERNITLKTPDQKPDCEKTDEENVKRYVMLTIDSIPASYAAKIKGIENNMVNINRALINLGYAKYDNQEECLLLGSVFDAEMKEAEEASEGSWADCLFYYKK